MLSKSIDVFIAVAAEALILELAQSKIYHPLNVTFRIVCEITAKVLKVEQAHGDIKSAAENNGMNHFHPIQALNRQK